MPVISGFLAAFFDEVLEGRCLPIRTSPMDTTEIKKEWSVRKVNPSGPRMVNLGGSRLQSLLRWERD